MFSQQRIQEFQRKYPLIKEMIALQPVLWFNPSENKKSYPQGVSLDKQDMHEAEQLWQRFAPFLAKEFPETKDANGIIESALRKIAYMQEKLERKFPTEIAGNMYLKCDNELAVAGSIKARGGFFEVLHYAESLAMEAGLITKEDSYEAFSNQAFRDLFKQYTIGVGSTGNLGLSIGIMSAKLGFNVSVYMSAD